MSLSAVIRDSLIRLLHSYSRPFHHIFDYPLCRNYCHIWIHSLKLLKIRILRIMLVNLDIDLSTCKYKSNSLCSNKYHSLINTVWNYFLKTIQKKKFIKILIQDYWYHKKYNTLVTCIIQEFFHRKDNRTKSMNLFSCMSIDKKY